MAILLAYKLGMMSLVDERGWLVPTTLLQVKPNFVTQVKTAEKDGYEALQVATAGAKAKKPQLGHLKRAGVKEDLSRSRELRLRQPAADHQAGQQLKVDVFKVGDAVRVTAKSKGKGFAGAIKRHNFSRQPKSHGGHGHVREVGAIGSIFPQKVVKGKKMPGRLGGKKTTVKGLQISLVDEDRQLLGVRGAVPGPRRGLVMVRKA